MFDAPGIDRAIERSRPVQCTSVKGIDHVKM